MICDKESLTKIIQYLLLYKVNFVSNVWLMFLFRSISALDNTQIETDADSERNYLKINLSVMKHDKFHCHERCNCMVEESSAQISFAQEPKQADSKLLGTCMIVFAMQTAFNINLKSKLACGIT